MSLLIFLGSVLMAAWRVARRTLFWDDFLIPAKYAVDGMPSFTDLFQPHDGHVMPGAIFIQSAVSMIAPLQWWLPATLITAGTALSTLLWILALGKRHPLALTALVFSPFLGAALGWWSTAINALGWQLAMALSVLLIRRYAQKVVDRNLAARLALGCAITASVFAGLLLSERALSIVPAITILIAIFPDFWQIRGTSRKDLATVLAPSWFLTFGWAALYAWLVINTAKPTVPTDSTTIDNANVIFRSIPRAFHDAIGPGLLGGPWKFERWAPGMSFASPTPTLAICGTIATGLVIALWFWTNRQVWRTAVLAIGLSAGYLALVFIALQIGRTGVGTTDLITRSLHYYADWLTITVLVATGTVAVRQSRIHQPRPKKHSKLTLRSAATAAACLAFIASSTVTSMGYLKTWEDDNTASWIHNVRSSLQASKAPLLPQPVPTTIAFRYSDTPVDISDIAAQMTNWPGVQKSTPEPQFLTDDGHLVPAGVFASATTGTDKQKTKNCGQKISLNKTTVIPVGNPLPFGEWTWELNTSATIPVNIRIATPNGLETYEDSINRATHLHLPTELTHQFVRVSGGGGQIEVLVTPAAGHEARPDDHLCLGAGAIGPLLPR